MDLVQLVIIYMIRFELIWKGGHKTVILHWKAVDFGAPPNPSSLTTAAPLRQHFPCFYCNIWWLDGVKVHTSDALEDIHKNIDFFMWLEVQCAIF